MTSLRTFGVLLAALLVLPACDSTAEYTIGGTYSGISNSQTPGFETTLSFTIPETESGSSFSFTGRRVQVGSATVTFSGTGTYDHPAITFDVDGDEVAGTVNEFGTSLTLDDDSGLGAFTLSLERPD